MDDIVKFLFVVAIIAVGIVQQYRKEARKKAAEQRPAPPVTSMPWPPETKEADEMDETFGGYIPEGPPAAPEPIEETVAPSTAGKHLQPQKAVQPTAYDTHTQPTVCGTLAQPTVCDTPAQPETEDYGIHSVEEARRAVIWSEILKRKTI